VKISESWERKTCMDANAGYLITAQKSISNDNNNNKIKTNH
jgi:hypothetical protein